MVFSEYSSNFWRSFGALVGVLSAQFLTTSFNQKNLQVSFIPTVENGSTGAMFRLSYNY